MMDLVDGDIGSCIIDFCVMCKEKMDDSGVSELVVEEECEWIGRDYY